jgi:hypothetical protein
VLVGKHALARNLQRGATGDLTGVVKDLYALFLGIRRLDETTVREDGQFEIEAPGSGTWLGRMFSGRCDHDGYEEEVRYPCRGYGLSFNVV